MGNFIRVFSANSRRSSNGACSRTNRFTDCCCGSSSDLLRRRLLFRLNIRWYAEWPLVTSSPALLCLDSFEKFQEKENYQLKMNFPMNRIYQSSNDVLFFNNKTHWFESLLKCLSTLFIDYRIAHTKTVHKNKIDTSSLLWTTLVIIASSWCCQV